MSIELTVLAWTLVLAFVQILLFDFARTGQYGLKWNMSARDGATPPLSPVALPEPVADGFQFETLPIFIAAVLIAHVAGRESAQTALGAQIFLAGRIVYVPLYAFGVPVLRSVVWVVSIAGLGMIVTPLLTG